MNSPFRLATLLAVAITGIACCLRARAEGPASTRESVQEPDSGKLVAESSSVMIPGPLRSFLRMASISQQAPLDDVLPLLARNIYTHGYQDSRPTEYLILLTRYVDQAQELRDLAGADGVIRVAGCAQARHLLSVLGYRLEPACGQSGASLVTDDPKRAFVSSDSGFPLSQLEAALRADKPFRYAYPATPVPVMFSVDDWKDVGKEGSRDLIGALLRDPALDHLYWGLAQMDSETQTALERAPGLNKLLPYGDVLDFYGSYICIRSGRVMVPGGAAAEPGWKELTGASPDEPTQFVLKLLAKDNGWLAA